MGRIGLKLKAKYFGPCLLAILSVACAHKVVVEIPPRIDLQTNQTIGIIEFSSNSTDKLNQYATQKFMSYVQGGQPQVRFLELGSEKELLSSVGHERMDPQAIKAIGKKYGVTSIFTGNYEISEMKPRISLGQDLTSINASAMVNITMAIKQWEAASGATPLDQFPFRGVACGQGQQGLRKLPFLQHHRSGRQVRPLHHQARLCGYQRLQAAL